MDINNSWLYLESYTFVNYDSDEIVILNTISNEVVIVKSSDFLLSIIHDLLDVNNMYCIKIPNSFLSNKDFKLLLLKLRESFCGDCVSCEEVVHKPLIIPPICNIQNDIKKGFRDNFNIIKYLHNISFQVTGLCDFNCANCKYYHQQFEFCNKNSTELPIENIKSILRELNGELNNITIIGGDIFKYPAINELVDYLRLNHFKATFRLCSNVLNNDFDRIALFKGFNIEVLLNNKDFLLDNIVQKLYEVCDLYKIRLMIKCPIVNEEEYLSFANSSDLNEIDMIPVFNESNESFFEKYVYIKKEDFKEMVFSKNRLFMNKNINTNNFGKFFVSSDGNVYSNVNLPAIGDISESIVDLIKKEFFLASGWFQIREKLQPCSTCAYNLLCPPSSNYEFAIGQSNLCDIR